MNTVQTDAQNALQRFLRQRRYGYLSLFALMFAGTAGVQLQLSLGGVLGMVGLTTAFAALCECILWRKMRLRLSRANGLLLVLLAVGFVGLACFAPQLAFSNGVLLLLQAAVSIICTAAAFRATRQTGNRIGILLLMIGLFCAGLFLLSYGMQVFSPDSYSYYDISKNLFGKVSTMRQYVLDTDRNISFPYLFPVCIAVIQRLTTLGMAAGLLMNVACMIGTLLVFLWYSKCYTNSYFAGGVVGFLLTTNPHYLDEVCSARAIPLDLLLLCGCFGLTIRLYPMLRQQTANGWLVCGLGVLAGLALMTRFDELPLVGYLCLVVLWLGTGKRLRMAGCYLAGVLLPVFPWIFYSLRYFHTPWITDNNGTFLMVKTDVPNRVLLPQETVDTLLTNPSAWLQQLPKRFHAVGAKMLDGMQGATWMLRGLLVLLVIVLLYNCYLKKRASVQDACKRLVALPHWRILAVTALFFAGKTLMYLLVGYAASRYHIATFTMLSFAVLMVFSGFLHRKTLYLLCIACCAGFGAWFSAEPPVMERTTLFQQIQQQPEPVTRIEADLRARGYTTDDAVLMIGYSGFTFGGLTDWKTYVQPTNLAWERIAYLLETHDDIRLIVCYEELGATVPEELLTELCSRYGAEECQNYYLFDRQMPAQTASESAQTDESEGNENGLRQNYHRGRPVRAVCSRCGKQNGGANFGAGTGRRTVFARHIHQSGAGSYGVPLSQKLYNRHQKRTVF